MIRGASCLGMETESVGDACLRAAAGEEEPKYALCTNSCTPWRVSATQQEVEGKGRSGARDAPSSLHGSQRVAVKAFLPLGVCCCPRLSGF